MRPCEWLLCIYYEHLIILHQCIPKTRWVRWVCACHGACGPLCGRGQVPTIASSNICSHNEYTQCSWSAGLTTLHNRRQPCHTAMLTKALVQLSRFPLRLARNIQAWGISYGIFIHLEASVNATGCNLATYSALWDYIGGDVVVTGIGCKSRTLTKNLFLLTSQ